MQFNVKCVRECLVNNGVVYTVRGYNMSDCFVYADDIGECYREKLFEVEGKWDLKLFVDKSGFESVDDWWNKIMDFTHGKRIWMYRVEKRGSDLYG